MKKDFDFMSEREILDMAKPKGYVEEMFLNKALKELGENTTVEKIAKYLNVSKCTIYRAIEDRRLLNFKVGSKNIVMTRTILNVIEKKY